ncbi:SprT family zinc-dependent metalloprotease [soil metagenome]
MIWKTILSIGKSEPALTADASISVGGVAIPVRIRRSARARNYRLTLDPAHGGLRLSIPARASVRKALGWAQGHEAWVSAQLATAPSAIRLEDGACFPLEGQQVRIVWEASAPRRIILDGDVLRVGGAAESVGSRLLRWLKARARAVLEAETRALATQAGLPLRSVGIGDTRSRWGSCASSGAIRYSWRLILAPPDVRQATVAHEVAHLAHLDHSPAFHAAHARLLGRDPRPARRWLKEHGAGLHRVGV